MPGNSTGMGVLLIILTVAALSAIILIGDRQMAERGKIVCQRHNMSFQRTVDEGVWCVDAQRIPHKLWVFEEVHQ